MTHIQQCRECREEITEYIYIWPFVATAAPRKDTIRIHAGRLRCILCWSQWHLRHLVLKISNCGLGARRRRAAH